MKDLPLRSTVARLSTYLRNPSPFVLILLAAPAFLSLALGVFQALHGSIDLQWSCARLVAMHEDPWKLYLIGDPHREIILGQQPNYLPELYILLLPLGLLSFPKAILVWAAISVALSIVSLWLTVKTFGLT